MKNISDAHHMLTDRDAATYLGKSHSWIRQTRCTGNPDAPSFIKIGKSVRYLKSDLDAYLEARRCRSTIEARANREARR